MARKNQPILAKDTEENDAWKKIKMEQDEEIAVQFWEDRLVERCWDVWKQGYQWTIVSELSLFYALISIPLYIFIDYHGSSRTGS